MEESEEVKSSKDMAQVEKRRIDMRYFTGEVVKKKRKREEIRPDNEEYGKWDFKRNERDGRE